MSDDHVEFPATPDYELDERLDADTAERMKALGDPIRLHIADLVLERAMSVTELAAIVGRSRGTVAHHVDVLVDAGLLRVVRTRRVRAIDERLYGRVARTFYVGGDPDDALPFSVRAQAEYDRERLPDDDDPVLFTLRHARIPVKRAAEWHDRLANLTLEFASQPGDGDLEFALYVGLFPTNRSRS